MIETVGRLEVRAAQDGFRVSLGQPEARKSLFFSAQ
jgi:hypothetical protein